MLCRHQRFTAIFTLAMLLVANPILAARPGTTSRRTKSLASQTKPTTSTETNDASTIKLVAGRQVQRSTSAAKQNTSARSASQTPAPSSSQTRSGSEVGLISQLFGSPKQSSPAPVAQQQQQPLPVDWEGIPYHQPRVKSITPRAPIRDLKPGERPRTSRSVVTQKTLSPTPAALPQPPQLSPAPSTRRVTAATSAPATFSQGTPVTLSRAASTRRSGRRDLPQLDVSEIRAAQSASVSEETIVPKVSRRSLATNDKQNKAADSPRSSEGEVISFSDREDSSQVAKTSEPNKKAANANAVAEKSPSGAESKDSAVATSTPVKAMPASTSSSKPIAAKTASTKSDVPKVAAAKTTKPESTPKPAASTKPEAPSTNNTDVAAETPSTAEDAALENLPKLPAPKPQKTTGSELADSFAKPQPPTAASGPSVGESNMPPSTMPIQVPGDPTFDLAGSAAGFRNEPVQRSVPPSAVPPSTVPPIGTQSQYPPRAGAPVEPQFSPLPHVSVPVGSGVAANGPYVGSRYNESPARQAPYPAEPVHPIDPYQPYPVAPNAAAAAPQIPQGYAPQQRPYGYPYYSRPSIAARPDYAPLNQPSAAAHPPVATQPVAPQQLAPSIATVPNQAGHPQSAPTVGVPGPYAPQPNRPVPAQSATPTPSIAGPAPVTQPAPAESAPVESVAPTAPIQPNRNAVASELPGIRVLTRGPSSVMIRQTHEFEIRIENRGSIDAAGLLVRAGVPQWAQILSHEASEGALENQTADAEEQLLWKIDSLPAGGAETLRVKLRANQSGVHKLDVDWTLVPQKSFAKVEVREPKLDLVIEGPEEVIYGQSQTYKVRVLNPGDGDAPNVVFTLSPNSSTPQTQRIGDIPSGKEAQFEVELTAQDSGDLQIHGLASGDLNLKAEAKKTIRVAAAKLEAVLSGPETKYQNTEATYHIKVTNQGSAASNRIAASVSLPSGAKYLAGLDSASQIGSKLSWEIRSLPPGATRDFEFTCMMTAPGEHRVEFAAAGTAAGSTRVALSTQVESIADLVMTIQDPAAPAPIGQEVAYEILIKNRGSRDAHGVAAIAQFSHGIEPRRIEGHRGKVLTGQVLLDPIETIRAGGEVKIRVIAVADKPGHHRFRTEIRSGETVLVAEEATHYMTNRVGRVSRSSTDAKTR